MFRGIQRSAFRLQLLDCYSVEFEKDEYTAFTNGESLLNRGGHPWLETISANVKAGRAWVNVHVLPPRLTPYLRYIVDWWYVYHAEAGADVRFVRAECSSEIRASAPRDFWLFDSETVVWMDYDAQGRFLGPLMSELPGQVALARRLSEMAVRESIDLKHFLSLRRSGEIV